MARFESLAVRLGLSGALVAALAACVPSPAEHGPVGVLAHLVDADAMTVHALHPYEHEYMDGGEFADQAETVERFCEQPILGTATVDDAATRDLLLRLVERGIAASDGSVAACFDPRHGISVEKDGVTTDFLICFECLSMDVFVDGVEGKGHLTSNAVEPDVSAIFGDLGLTIAE